MIRISMGKVKICKLGVDRWGCPIKFWSVNDAWGYVEEDFYKNLLFFEEPLKSETDVKYLSKAISDKMRAVGGYSVIHQFNVKRKNTEYYRMIAIMNSKDPNSRIQQISLFDAYVKIPTYSLICKVANKLIRDEYVI